MELEDIENHICNHRIKKASLVSSLNADRLFELTFPNSRGKSEKKSLMISNVPLSSVLGMWRTNFNFCTF